MTICVVTIAELWYGATKHRELENKRHLWGRLLDPFAVYAFDRPAAEIHGDLRHQLRENPIGERDLLMASIGLANDLTVVTANLREFRRVPKLRIEDWTAGRPREPNL
jgi:tRNA(fMet)-specific endonuclease VapC